MKILGMDGKPVTCDAKDDPVVITRELWDAVVENSGECIAIFNAIKQRLDAAEARLEALENQSKPKWWRR